VLAPWGNDVAGFGGIERLQHQLTEPGDAAHRRHGVGKLLPRSLIRPDPDQVQARVAMNQAHQFRAGVSSGSDDSNAQRARHRL
jgi:hypothetical protein